MLIVLCLSNAGVVLGLRTVCVCVYMLHAHMCVLVPPCIPQDVTPQSVLSGFEKSPQVVTFLQQIGEGEFGQ